MIRRTRFGNAPNLWESQQAQADERVEIFRPSLGFDAGRPPQALPPGFSPHICNFVAVPGGIQPRSGLTEFGGGASRLSGAALTAFRGMDLLGNNHIVAASNRTLTFYDGVSLTWSALTYQKPTSSDTNLPSGSTRQFWDQAVVYDPAADRNIAVLTNAYDMPKTLILGQSTTTYSDLTDFASLASRAQAVCAFDNRLVWFNVSASAQSYPQRVMWSPRGAPLNYQLAAGAGFEDLLDMTGQGKAVVPERDGIVLFSDEEIWRGRKRHDAYAFDFYPILRQFGCGYPRTIARTPFGICFLGRDLEVYILQGDDVQPLGPFENGDPSRIQPHLRDNIRTPEHAWSVYNSTDRRYELFFAGPDSQNGYATRALFYSFAERCWFPQTFACELSAGFDFREPSTPQTIDAETATIDEMAATFDTTITAGSGYYVYTVSSDGTAFRFDPRQANDNGTNFEACYRSHALNRGDHYAYDQMYEVRFDYKIDSSCTATVEVSSDLGVSFESSLTIPLQSGGYKSAFAPVFVSSIAPQFQITITDGGRPQIARLQAHLREGGAYGGER